jgi:hypothetical protein
LNNSTDSPSPVDINDDATTNFTRDSDEISFSQKSNSTSNENSDSIPKTIREEKLIAVSRLFHLCYRTVIPNRPPPITSNAVQGLSSFNPRPIGINLFFFFFF